MVRSTKNENRALDFDFASPRNDIPDAASSAKRTLAAGIRSGISGSRRKHAELADQTRLLVSSLDNRDAANAVNVLVVAVDNESPAWNFCQKDTLFSHRISLYRLHSAWYLSKIS